MARQYLQGHFFFLMQAMGSGLTESSFYNDICLSNFYCINLNEEFIYNIVADALCEWSLAHRNNVI